MSRYQKDIFFLAIGFIFGALIASGVFSFLILIGVI